MLSAGMEQVGLCNAEYVCFIAVDDRVKTTSIYHCLLLV